MEDIRPMLQDSATSSTQQESQESSLLHPSETLETASSQGAADQFTVLSSRFVGDLNPEGIFMQATTPGLQARQSSYRDTSDLGTWFQPSTQQDAEAALGSEARGRSPPPQSSLAQTMSPPATKSVIQVRYEQGRDAYLSMECLTQIPPEDDYQALKSIFLRKMHPIFPVFNDSDLNGSSSSGRYATVTKQVIALVAATDSSASSHLRLERHGPVLTFQAFHERLASAIIAVLDAGLVKNRVDLIRILTLLSFFLQPGTTGDRNQAALLLSHAVHHFQSIGAHLPGYRPPRQGEDIERLFCAVWALDRLTATLYARPCLLHEQDIDRDIDACIGRQPPCFQLFLKVVRSLDQVINLYRPRQPFVLIDMPVFEALILDAGADKLSTTLLGG